MKIFEDEVYKNPDKMRRLLKLLEDDKTKAIERGDRNTIEFLNIFINDLLFFGDYNNV